MIIINVGSSLFVLCYFLFAYFEPYSYTLIAILHALLAYHYNKVFLYRYLVGCVAEPVYIYDLGKIFI